ncbi:MAG: hypothetical protein ABR509_01380, partial [Candidatus Limnocylindria bacterium]
MTDPEPAISPHGRAAEFRRRAEQLRGVAAARGAGAALLASRRNFAWLTVGGLNHVVSASEEGAASILVTASEVVALAPINEAARLADEELTDLPIEVVTLDWFEPGAAAADAGRRARGAVLVDDDVERDLVPIRSVLSDVDQLRLAWLGRRVRDALADAVVAVQAGDTELEAAVRLTAALERDGVRAPVSLA